MRHWDIAHHSTQLNTSHNSPTLSGLQFHELAVWVTWDPGKMQLLSFRCFFLRKAHQELRGLKGEVLFGKEVQQESRDGNQVAKEGRNKDTMHLTERRWETGSTPSTNPNVVWCLLDGSFDDLQTRSKLYDVPWAMLCHYSTWWCCCIPWSTLIKDLQRGHKGFTGPPAQDGVHSILSMCPASNKRSEHFRLGINSWKAKSPKSRPPADWSGKYFVCTTYE